MPCISGTYDPKVGLMVQVGLLPRGAIGASGSKAAPPEQGQQHTVTTAPALIDTGASQTGISPQLATQLDLEPHGKIALQGATGSTSVNTYHVNFVLSFGTQAIVVQNLNSTPSTRHGASIPSILAYNSRSRIAPSLVAPSPSQTLSLSYLTHTKAGRAAKRDPILNLSQRSCAIRQVVAT